MRKLVFILLIFLVLGIMGFYCWMEFSIPVIEYVADSTTINGDDAGASIRRIYSSGVDVDGLTAELDSSLIATEFTEEEIYEAALKSGKPEFCPAFGFSVYKPDIAKDEYLLVGYVRQEMASTQTRAPFTLADLRLEAVASGMKITSASANPDAGDTNVYPAAVVSADGTNMTLAMPTLTMFQMKLSGTQGTLMLQFEYNIDSSSILPREIMPNQLLIANVTITGGETAPTVAVTTEAVVTTEDLE